MSTPKERWVVRDYFDIENMVDDTKKFKNLRKSKLAAFTRKNTHLQGLLDDGIGVAKLEEVFGELKAAYSALETAHDSYVGVADEEALEQEGDYMEAPSKVLNDMDLKISNAVRNLKEIEYAEIMRKGLENQKIKFRVHVENFGSPSKLISELSAEKKVSVDDMRKEMLKVESAYERLSQEKLDLLNANSTEDFSELVTLFDSLVVREVERCKTAALDYMKDVPVSPAPASTGDSSSRHTSFSTTKRETVMLPHFNGDEKTGYLKYPVWKAQWNEHINEYELKYRPTMLLNHLDEKAQHQIVGLETDYEAAMKQLDAYYGDPKKIVRACLDEVRAQPQVNAFDYKGLVQYKKCLVNNHARLKAAKLEHEISNTATMGVLIRKLPIQEAVEYQKYLSEQSIADQSRPFPHFIKWLEKAGASWELLAASGTGVKGKSGGVQVHHSFYGAEEDGSVKTKRACYKCGEEGHLKKDCTRKDSKVNGGGKGSRSSSVRKPRDPPKHRKHHCAFHRDATDRYCVTWSCPSIKYTPYSERIKLLKANGDCETCCGDCPKNDCLAKVKRVCGGGKDGRGCGTNHIGHELWCSNAKLCFAITEETVMRATNENEDGVLLQLMKIPSVDGSAPFETVLWDTACSGQFVREKHAKEKGFQSKKQHLRVVTLGGVVKEIDSIIYDCKIKDLQGNVHEFFAHGLEQITGSLNTALGEKLMRQLFPNLVGGYKMCGAEHVDYLIGLGKASWQPERTIRATGGGDFWVWQNRFGSCVGGSHPLVGNYVARSDSLFTVLKVVDISTRHQETLKIPTCTTFKTMISPLDAEDFFKREQLCTTIEPRCGSCRCGKCPVPGSRYSFREENELKLIEGNMRYDEEKSSWIAAYPYVFPRETLAGTKSVALKSMMSTERMLLKNPNWGSVYQSQIQDMLDRSVARIVPQEELDSYGGVVNYLPHLAVSNPRSDSTPVRICFDASRPQGGGPSLNAILAKGPDRYLNNLAGVIIRFRSGTVAMKADVKKMYNGVLLEREDCFVQCFLWRDLDQKSEPKTYQVVVNNIGVKPAGCISTLAVYKSADRFKEEFPVTVNQLKRNSYVDDLGLTARSKKEAAERTKQADIILAHANMKVKGWVISGDNADSVNMGEQEDCIGEIEPERMLGLLWEPKRDIFRFKVRINLSSLKKKERLGPDLTRQELIHDPPKSLTRRQYYSQIQSLFDPLGFLSPVLLTAKVLLRKTWEDGCERLGWDEPLPLELSKKMFTFFIELFDLEEVTFSRSLIPVEETVGRPELVLFSDGSIQAFGSAAYIRWKLLSGSWWATLILAKSKIAPKGRITVPRLELNGAVLSKRLEEFIESDLDIEFENIYHLVDSSTVLGYLHKSDAKLKPYEGIRVSEIQTHGKFIDERLHNWGWIDTENNPADWSTKPRSAADLKPDGFWQSGPSFLKKDYSEWPIKLDFRVDRLEGEMLPKGVFVVQIISEEIASTMENLLQRISSVGKLFRIFAYGFQWLVAVNSSHDQIRRYTLSPKALSMSRNLWVKLAQKEIEEELELSVNSKNVKVSGRFRKLSPYKDECEVWRVGSRIREFTPFTSDRKPPVLLPHKHRLTLLLMRNAHEKKHSGIVETVSQFRLSGYWTVKANQLAKAIKERCVICRYLDHTPMQQSMGAIPEESLRSLAAWKLVEIDLFGPFECRSDVHKRASKKIWGMIVVDKNSKAIHCDVVYDYSTQETIKTFRRFVCLRGWPAKVTSDPGSQLASAAGNMGSWMENLGGDLADYAGGKGFSWCISPADSPWRQGRAEVSIKLIKRLIRIAVGNARLTPSELQTVLFEVADMCNNRPIGVNKSPREDGTFAVLTPNCLLMGRASNCVPDDSDLEQHLKKSDRYILIQQVTKDFWEKWTTEVTPMHVIRQKWHENRRNLAVKDIVLVHEKSPLKGKYVLAIVDSVNTSKDGLVRSCVVSYRIPNSRDTMGSYSGGRLVKLTRSIQRLTLILPVEEQHEELRVIEDGSKNVIVKANSENPKVNS